VVTLATFLPALGNDFVNWDDYGNLVENPYYRGLGWAQLRWMFTAFHMGHYHPLTWVTFGIDYLLWGMEPFGYHLTNLLLHAANAVLFYLVALRLLALAHSARAWDFRLDLAAGFAALFFAIHPLRVESVAWVTERRDVLSSFFLLGTVLCYLRAVAAEGAVYRWWIGFAVVLYVLSLLSKAGGMTLPVVLLVLDVYPLRRLVWGRWFEPEFRRVWIDKVSFLLIACVFGILALLAQQEFGALRPLEKYGFTIRLAQAFFGIVFYLWKTILPTGLSPLYAASAYLDPLSLPFLFSAVLVLGISSVLFALRRRYPATVTAWVCYIVILSPVLGIAQSGAQFVADRYSYLSTLSWALLAGGSLLCYWGRLPGGRGGADLFGLVEGLAVVVLVGLGTLTWRQAQVWRDSETLWRHALSIGTESTLAHYNLGIALANRGALDEAIQHLRRAVESSPNNTGAHYNLGVALSSRGDLDGAVEHYREAVRIDPAHVEAHNNLGFTLARQGKLNLAIEHYREALRLRPNYANAHYNLGIALTGRGEVEEAIRHYQEALRINPADADAYYDLGLALAGRGKLDEAIQNFRQTLRIQPEYAEAHESLARVLAEQGKMDEAAGHYQEALRIKKSSPASQASKEGSR
jgi:tetratricopeptide (TPR) repeat protein